MVLKIDTLDDIAYCGFTLTTYAEVSWPQPRFNSGWHAEISFKSVGPILYGTVSPLAWSENSVNLLTPIFTVGNSTADLIDSTQIREAIINSGFHYSYELEFIRIDAALPEINRLTNDRTG
jgi:hypothetical protein